MNNKLPKLNKWILLLVVICVSLSLTALIFNSVREGGFGFLVNKNPAFQSGDSVDGVATVKLVSNVNERYIDVYITSNVDVIAADIAFNVQSPAALSTITEHKVFEDAYLSNDTTLTMLLGPSNGERKFETETYVARISVENFEDVSNVSVDPTSSFLTLPSGDTLTLNLPK